MPLTLAQLLLIARSPRLEDINEASLLQLQKRNGTVVLENCVIALSRLLASEGIIDQPVRRLGLQPKMIHGASEALVADVPHEWARLAWYWHETSTLTPRSRLRMYYRLLTVGRWLQATRPHIESPVQWNRTVTSEAVAMSVNLSFAPCACASSIAAFSSVGVMYIYALNEVAPRLLQ
jgi:hypothetical protein